MKPPTYGEWYPGNIISAHYSKIEKGFQFKFYGWVTPITYFNPTPNDRNLEFDKDHNLYEEESDATHTVLVNP